MSESIVIIVALKEEFHPPQLPDHVHLYYSGIGKINACMATLKAIHERKPSLIVNFGTAGAVKPALSGLLPISRVIQRDVITTLAPRGQMPLCPRPVHYQVATLGHVCGTGDTFVTEPDPWLEQVGVDIVDMELFAIAAVAHEHQVPWQAYKFVTDQADSNSVNDWQTQMHHGQTLYLDKINHIVNGQR